MHSIITIINKNVFPPLFFLLTRIVASPEIKVPNGVIRNNVRGLASLHDDPMDSPGWLEVLTKQPDTNVSIY